VTTRLRNSILLIGAVALLAIGASGCANGASVSGSSLTLSVPNSDASAMQDCLNLGVSSAQCTAGLNALHGAGIP
jgi:hypothetical protein